VIEKPTIIVTSLGRTGTKFFQALFETVVPDSTSVHEPDVFNIVQYRGWSERVRRAIAQVKNFGAYNLFIRKTLGKWSLIALSDARVRGELGYAEAVERVLEQRRKFVFAQSGSIYIEASIGYYGLIDVLETVYACHRIAYIVRDGRDWVRSHMNWGEMYGKGKIRSLIAHTWPAATDLKGDSYAMSWNSMSRFERLCWAWSRLNEYALETVENNPTARPFFFEDIFRSNDRYQHLEDMVQFLVNFQGIGEIKGSLEGWLDRKIHGSTNQFPKWEDWTTEQKNQFSVLCGPLMKELGYWDSLGANR
jgi:hypothetical protein